ncbi:MAG TPA: hypothetical protein VGF83_03450 [Actinomycetota bacterium]
MTLPHTWIAGPNAYVRWQFRLAAEGAGFTLAVKELDAKRSRWRVVCRWRDGELAQWSGHHRKVVECAAALLSEQAQLDKLIAAAQAKTNRRRKSA